MKTWCPKLEKYWENLVSKMIAKINQLLVGITLKKWKNMCVEKKCRFDKILGTPPFSDFQKKLQEKLHLNLI